MILTGIYHKLTVDRVTDHGLYLTDGEDDVLLPNRYVSLRDKVGDEMEVFVYNDSEDRPVATTEHPLITVGQAAFLRVVDKTVHGAFLDWGLTAKDLFLPNRNMSGRLDADNHYLVYAYRDRITGRTVATMNLREYIRNEEMPLRKGDRVEVLVALRTAQGYRVIIENRWWGMIYDNQVFAPLRLGDRVEAFVRKITEDNRVDLSLQQEGYDEVKASADRLMKLVEENGGTLPIGDRSDAARVSQLTGMSKKVFKRAAGYLMKRGTLTVEDESVSVAAQAGGEKK